MSTPATQCTSGADQCGYYDQSLLIHDFRSFAGLSPVELVRQTRPDPQGVVIR